MKSWAPLVTQQYMGTCQLAMEWIISRKENCSFHSTLKELSGSKRLEVNVTKRNNLPCLVLHHRKYPDPISGSNNTVRSYYANHFENSFDPHTSKEQHFVVMLEVQDNYSNVMGLVKVSEQTAQLDINCLGVKSCSKWWLCDTGLLSAVKKTGLKIQNNHIITNLNNLIWPKPPACTKASRFMFQHVI